MKKLKEQSQEQIWDAIAPEWHTYKERPSKLSEEFLKNQKGKILDHGSGSGRHLHKFKDEIENKTKGKIKREYYLVDFSQKMLDLAKEKAENIGISERAHFEKASLAKLPFEDNLFDGAISISAIHCTPKAQHKKIVKELYRVLKPGAKALIGVWNKDSKRFKRYKEKERYIGWTDKGKRYYYLFDEAEIHKLFKDAGFKITSTHNSELMINFIIQK